MKAESQGLATTGPAPSWESRACGHPREVGEAAPRVGTAGSLKHSVRQWAGVWVWTDCESPDPTACTRPSSLGQLGVPGQSQTVSPGPWALTPSHSSLLPPPAQAWAEHSWKGPAFPLWAQHSVPRTPNPSTEATAFLGQPGTSGRSLTVASRPPTHPLTVWAGASSPAEG